MSSVSATKFFISSTWVSIVPLSKVSSVSIEILAYNPARNGLLTSVWTVALLTTSGMFFLLFRAILYNLLYIDLQIVIIIYYHINSHSR